jgi:hypothetical protein
MLRPPATMISARVESILVVALFLAVSIWSAVIQRGERVFGDATQYHAMAQQFTAGTVPVIANAPFVYRPATPWLASRIEPTVTRALPAWLDRAIEDSSGLKGVAPFYIVNIVAALAATFALLAYLRRFVPHAAIRVAMLAAWMLQWQAPVRFVYFYPVNVEPLFLVFVVSGLLVIERSRARLDGAGTLLLTVMAFAGTLCRESMLLVALTFAVCHLRRVASPHARWRARLWILPPIAACAAALAVAHTVGASAVVYHPWTELGTMVTEKPVSTWLLAWSFAFGLPVIALVAAAAKGTLATLQQRPEMAFYLAGCGLLAFVGGTDTERILGWAAPVVYVLAGRAIAALLDVLRHPRVLAPSLVAMQSISARWFWPIPVGVDSVRPFAQLDLSWPAVVEMLDKLLVIDDYYANLWSFYGSRIVHSVILAFDVCFVMLFVLFVRRSLQQLPSVGRGLRS